MCWIVATRTCQMVGYLTLKKKVVTDSSGEIQFCCKGWLRGVDLNHRPLGYEPNELPDCSNPRFDDNNRVTERQTCSNSRRHCCIPSALQFVAFAGGHDLCGIDGFTVDLFFQNLAVLSDQKIYAARGFVLVDVDAILAGGIAAPVAGVRKLYAYLVGEGFIGEG